MPPHAPPLPTRPPSELAAALIAALDALAHRPLPEHRTDQLALLTDLDLIRRHAEAAWERALVSARADLAGRADHGGGGGWAALRRITDMSLVALQRRVANTPAQQRVAADTRTPTIPAIPVLDAIDATPDTSVWMSRQFAQDLADRMHVWIAADAAWETVLAAIHAAHKGRVIPGGLWPMLAKATGLTIPGLQARILQREGRPGQPGRRRDTARRQLLADA